MSSSKLVFAFFKIGAEWVREAVALEEVSIFEIDRLYPVAFGGGDNRDFFAGGKSIVLDAAFDGGENRALLFGGRIDSSRLTVLSKSSSKKTTPGALLVVFSLEIFEIFGFVVGKGFERFNEGPNMLISSSSEESSKGSSFRWVGTLEVRGFAEAGFAGALGREG